jgi:hypothetical protein
VKKKTLKFGNKEQYVKIKATHVQTCAEVIKHMGVRTNRRWITQTISAEVSHEGSLVVGSSP